VELFLAGLRGLDIEIRRKLMEQSAEFIPSFTVASARPT